MATILSWRMPQYPQVVIRHVPKLQAGEWVRRGWDDLRYCGAPSFAHGALIAFLGAVLLILGSSHPFFVAAAVSGYLLVGPIMTTGLCELSRRRAAGELINFDASMQAINRNPRALRDFGVILAVIAIIWFAGSEVMLRSIFGIPWPSFGELLWGGSVGKASVAEILIYVGTGAVFAAVVFAMSVVAVPLIIDKHVTAGEAIAVSVKATLANPAAMLRWAALIVGLTALGFFTLLIGMIYIAPLLGHATWHAYRDLVAESS